MPVLLRVSLAFTLLVALFAGEPELAVRFAPANEGQADGWKPNFSTLPFAAFHFQKGALGQHPITAEISGFISVDLRAQHTFTIEHTGAAELILNGKELLRTSNSEILTNLTSNPIRLNKGTNAVLIRYHSPSTAPSTFRLLWSSKNIAVPIPIPAAALSHTSSAEHEASAAIKNGAFLFAQFQCGRCHTPEEKALIFDAPPLDGVGSRLKQEWIISKILNPSTDHPSRMPKLLRGEKAEADAIAIAAFLGTLTEGGLAETFSPGDGAAGATLMKDLNCASCHTLPSEARVDDRISLAHVSRKYSRGALVRYLENPQATYRANPMPNFKLTRSEAESIASCLLQSSSPAPSDRALPGPEFVETGRALVQKSGCLNCHSAALPNLFTAPLLKLGTALTGCLDLNSAAAPQFDLTPTQRADLKAFLASGEQSSVLPSADFTRRAIEFLRCDRCHSENNLPSPIALGGKLKPDWSASFISGAKELKPRPWLNARMPGFPAYATNIATGLAVLHGYARETPVEAVPDPELVKLGDRLISASGGFSCVACHAVGSNSLQVVVESPGVNLAYSSERLLPDYFRRWLMNPIAIDPGTKMPAYFDAEGRSQLIEFLEGDAQKQIDAMWHYIRFLGSAK